MRKYVSLAVVSLLVLSMILPLKFNTHAECEPTVTDLIAGQHTVVGTVTVWNDAISLYVKYSTTGGWVLTETHLAVATSFEDIPQTKKGNPIIGHFPYREMHSPVVTEYIYVIDLGAWSAGTELYIAAHAVVLCEMATVVMSDTNTLVTAGNVGGATYPHNAVYAWEPFADADPSYWDQNLDYDFSASGADWIWESYRVVHPVSGDIIYFSRTFEIGKGELWGLTESELWITCDNAYEVYLNGGFVGSAQLGGGWSTSDLTETYVNWDSWQTVENYDVFNLLKSGENILEIAAANEYMGPLDGQQDGTEYFNPAGLIFELNLAAVQEETAFGDGEDFPGSNWFMYFTYTICEQ